MGKEANSSCREVHQTLLEEGILFQENQTEAKCRGGGFQQRAPEEQSTLCPAQPVNTHLDTLLLHQVNRAVQPPPWDWILGQCCCSFSFGGWISHLSFRCWSAACVEYLPPPPPPQGLALIFSIISISIDTNGTKPILPALYTFSFPQNKKEPNLPHCYIGLSGIVANFQPLFVL